MVYRRAPNPAGLGVSVVIANVSSDQVVHTTRLWFAMSTLGGGAPMGGARTQLYSLIYDCNIYSCIPYSTMEHGTVLVAVQYVV